MSTSLRVSSTSNFQTILDKALIEYKKKTGKDLITHSLADQIKNCDSPEAILTVLQGKANELKRSQSDERLTKWLTPTVNILTAFSSTLGDGVSTVFPPSKVIFSAIGILLVAAKDTAASRDVLIELFDKIESFFVRIQTYTEVPPTAEMISVMGKIMAEVLCILAIMTKEMKQGRTKTFFKKLAGRTDVEDALRRLDKLEQGELRTVAAQVLKTTGDIKDGMERIEVIAQRIVTDVGARDWKHLLQDLRRWLPPPDPSINHNIMCSAQHERTSAWLFKEVIYEEWESKGQLLWIHGKPGSGKSVLCSAIIQHIVALRDAGLASIAYFYFDFRDTDKKHRRNFLCSLLIQLSAYSNPCCKILYRIYSECGQGTQQPNDDALKNCLWEMFSVTSAQHPIYIVMDAVDECPDTPGAPSPRQQVLSLIEDLVDRRLPNLHICVTSRPEIDIRNTLEPLTSRRISLHDQPGQKEDIAEYVSSVVHSDVKMKKWREDDRSLIIETLSEKADGMFRWVFCQLEVLRHCLAPSLRRQLNELPKTLDETYERILKEIESTNQGRHARRLLQCLAVAIRPLRVEELAEVLAFDLDAVKEEIPRFHAEWRWEDQEQAVLSACSSLISVIDSDDSRVIRFSHFSVKEYLTSDRLATTSGDVSQYHIIPEAAHLTLARACLGVLLNLDNYVNKECDQTNDESSGKHSDKHVPLLKYAAKHWVSHTQFGNVSSCLKDAMETLFDPDKPYFLEWIQIDDHDKYRGRSFWCDFSWRNKPNPMYYAALCGLYDLVRHLIVKHPEQVNHRGGNHQSPLVAALFKQHIRIAELLLEHGAHVHVREDPPLCHAVTFEDVAARVNATEFLLRHGARVNAGQKIFSGQTPLHLAARGGCLDVARILLEHSADVNLRDNWGQVPLHEVSNSFEMQRGDNRYVLAQLLVERFADVNAQDIDGATPLHLASYNGRLEIARLLLDHGAKFHTENVQGQNSLHKLLQGFSITSLLAYDDRKHPQNVLNVAQLLLEHGEDINGPDKDYATPLHFASSYGMLEIARLLLDHGAKANAENVHGQTPLHLVSQSEVFSNENPDVTRLLLERGMDVNAKDKDQATPLHFAYLHGNFEIALVLLDHGADVNARNTAGQTPLHQVSRYRSPDANTQVTQLMLLCGADVNARDKDQATPLHLTSYVSMTNTARVLIENGANIHAENVQGQTPLHMVSQGVCLPDENLDLDLVRLLLEQGADVNARDKDQATPLHLAFFHKKPRIARMLLDNGANVNAMNTHGQNALHQLSQIVSYTEIVYRDELRSFERHFAQLLLERNVDANARDKEQATPLHVASYYGHLRVAEVLLDHGVQANAEDFRGQTPLHKVVLGIHGYRSFGMDWWDLKNHPGRVACLAQRLLERGADVNVQNKDRETPLHLASRLRLHEMARILVEHGADVNVKNSEGKSPLQLASGRKGKAMKRLLSEYSAKRDTQS